MRVEVDVRQLRSALTKINKMVRSKCPQERFTKIKVEALGDKVRLIGAGYDDTSWMILDLPATVEEEGMRIVCPRELRRALTGARGDIKLVGGQDGEDWYDLEVHILTEITYLPAMLPGQWIPDSYFESKAKPVAQTSMRRVLDLIGEVPKNTHKSSKTPIFSGIRLSRRDGKLKAVANNGYIGHMRELDAGDKEFEDGWEVIIPPKTVEYLKGTEGPVEISWGAVDREGWQGDLVFQTRDSLIGIRTIQGPYPNYEGIIPETDRHFTANREDLVKALLSTLPQTIGEHNLILLEFDAKKLAISTGGYRYSSIPVKQRGKRMEHTLLRRVNCKYLLQILEEMDTEEVRISLGPNNKHNLVIEPVGDISSYLLAQVKND